MRRFETWWRIAPLMLAITAAGFASSAAEPIISEAHSKVPLSEQHSIRAQCGGEIVVSWAARADGPKIVYDAFAVTVGGKAVLSEAQAGEALAALNRFHEKYDLVIVGGKVRCDRSRAAGTVMFFNDSSRRRTAPGYLFIILGDHQEGLMFKPSSGPPVKALAYAG